MTSRNTSSVSGSRSSSKADGKDNKKIEEGEQVNQPFGNVLSTIHQLKKKVVTNRAAYVKERIDSNAKNLAAHTAYLMSITGKAQDLERDGIKNMLTSRMETALCKLSGSDSTSGDKENVNCQEEGSSASSPIISVSSLSIKLPAMEMIPPYTTWIFLDRTNVILWGWKPWFCFPFGC